MQLEILKGQCDDDIAVSGPILYWSRYLVPLLIDKMLL